MMSQSELYRPTSFWADASLQIASELCVHGVEGFRSLSLPLSYFVPTYGAPGNSFSAEETDAVLRALRTEAPNGKKQHSALDQFPSGSLSAFDDYRVLVAADDPMRMPYLHTFSESTVGEPIEQFEFEGRRFSRSALNYLLGLALLKKHLDGFVPRTVLEIGGGFGTLGEVLTS